MTRFRCSCGHFGGSISDARPETGLHVTCFCDDCQTYAFALGHPERVLDERGGTTIYQCAPAQVVIEHGQDALACIRLSPKGLLRFYASCCNTPFANMLPAAGMPFIGMPTAQFEGDCNFGPAVGVQGRFARGGRPDGVAARAPVGVLVQTVWRLGRNAIAGRARPSPVRGADGALLVEPVVLALEERDRFAAAASAATRPA